MKGELKMDVNDYLPLRDVVFNTLRQAILRGEMEPGERLMEIQLADKLGVSRTPIREAIRKLELEGLVIMIPRKGAEVAHITLPFSITLNVYYFHIYYGVNVSVVYTCLASPFCLKNC